MSNVLCRSFILWGKTPLEKLGNVKKKLAKLEILEELASNKT